MASRRWVAPPVDGAIVSEVDAASRAAQPMRDYLGAHHGMVGDSPGETFPHLFESALADSGWSDVPRRVATTAVAISFDGIDSPAAR